MRLIKINSIHYGSNHSPMLPGEQYRIDQSGLHYEINFKSERRLVSKHQTIETDKIELEWSLILIYNGIEIIYKAHATDIYSIEESDQQISDNEIEQILITAYDALCSYLNQEKKYLYILPDITYPLDGSRGAISNMQQYLLVVRNALTGKDL